MDKKEIRKQKLNARNNIEQDKRKNASKIIRSKVMKYLSENKEIQMIGCYASFGSEVETHELIHELLKTHRVALPICEREGIMHFYEIHDLNECKLSSMSILEPENKNLIEPNKLDLLLIPLVAYDKEMYRIGYGKGYYDRYLKNSNAKRIGLAYQIQECVCCYPDEYDEKLDKILNEK